MNRPLFASAMDGRCVRLSVASRSVLENMTNATRRCFVRQKMLPVAVIAFGRRTAMHPSCLNSHSLIRRPDAVRIADANTSDADAR